MRIVSHGIEFIRTGKCKQCGDCGCGDCPHHYTTLDEWHWCQIYDSRQRRCPSLCYHTDNDGTHANCIKFPDNPWIRVVRQGTCGFIFERADSGSMDELKFLNGEPYYGNHNA